MSATLLLELILERIEFMKNENEKLRKEKGQKESPDRELETTTF